LDTAEDFIEVDSLRSTSLLDGVSLGSLAPGSTTTSRLYEDLGYR
jgi:hypothetical protein